MDVLKLDTQIACDDRIDVELTSPVNGVGTGIYLQVVGKDSKICQDYSRDQIDEALKKAHRAKQRGRDVELQSSAKLKMREIDFLTACTVGWYCKVDSQGGIKDTITFGDEELVFNPSNVRKLFKKLPWIASQADDAIGDLSLFMKG